MLDKNVFLTFLACKMDLLFLRTDKELACPQHQQVGREWLVISVHSHKCQPRPLHTVGDDSVPRQQTAERQCVLRMFHLPFAEARKGCSH